ncbi:hypothetical protein GCM10010112_90470 [Actinoplanes lobatus]|uniref:Transmembrane protein n=1 Tax=Actinoplanes lobatus TaxID=113568 RepID=A0A7W7HLK9_9ACTN|nr:hypothetical protein [Actinoplanes lobatus]MBB4752452.1 hypothetical protein [Actinoplanes lobatus]GGN97829.1 hypothetical protein GCM10010112_90470 [Actinoplanes lobatus]GIE45805.1 hypothetical protein Alo02nite_87030 [Actinoplanes lobatus]
MHNLEFAVEGAWRVLLVSLVLGAGLPALFGLGVRALAYGAGGDAEVHESGVAGPAPHRIGTVVAWILFATVLLGVALGIAFIVASGLGKTLSFEHVFPTIVDK